MQYEDQPHKNAPDDERGGEEPAAVCIAGQRQYAAQQEVRRKEHCTNPAQHWVFGQIRRPAANVLGMMLWSLPEAQPKHVAPPRAFMRRMWIAFLIAVSVMLAMICYPIDH